MIFPLSMSAIFLSFKNILKSILGDYYVRLRFLLFPMYLAWYEKHIASFVEPVLKTVNYNGYSYKIQIDPKNGFIDSVIYSLGVYEEDMLDMIASVLKNGDTYVDIGTNIGQHALFARSVVGESGAVICFEPIPRLAKQVAVSIAANNFKNIALNNFALGDKSDKVKISLRENNIGGSSIVPFVQGGELIEIEVRVGDEVLKNVDKINVLKVDVEGYEPQVFEGLRETLARHHPVIFFEYSPIFWGDNKVREGLRIANVLMPLGYSFVDMETGQIITDLYEFVKNDKRDQLNIICK